VVNPYQKPVALGAWFVKHFSEPGDWVADLCCGTGSVLVASLLSGRHGSAVDKAESQIQFLTNRIMTLESTFSLDGEAVEGGEGVQGQEVQPPISGELGTISTLAMDVVVEEGDDEEVAEENDEEGSGANAVDDLEMDELLHDS
jgi:putative intracellular protease/amidase